MSAELRVRPTLTGLGSSQEAGSDRRADIDAKGVRVATLLQTVGCDGLLLLDPENLAWLTSGGMDRSLNDPLNAPAAYCNGEQRWIFAANADSQRLFDEEVDDLGFQLKEWPWHWGREQLLADISQNRKIACDQPRPGMVDVGPTIRRLRCLLTVYEQACQQALGQIVAHALEATCRTLNRQDTEREVAGQLAHRLIHRGALPVHVGVAADGRSRIYRRFGFTSAPVQRYAVLTATARKYGLIVTASRSVCFGELPEDFRQEHNAVCRVGASYLASTWPDAVPREVLIAGRRIYLISGFEHEWMQAPQGFLTGRAPVEMSFLPQTEDLFQAGWSITWTPNAGAATQGDTYLVTTQGPRAVTPTEGWPLKSIRIQGAGLVQPDVLQR